MIKNNYIFKYVCKIFNKIKILNIFILKIKKKKKIFYRFTFTNTNKIMV